MELQQNSNPVMEPQKSSKKWGWIIMLLVLVLAIAGAYYWVMSPTETGDVSIDVQEDLESIDLGDLEAEMESLEMDLDQL